MNIASKTYNLGQPFLCIKTEYIYKDTIKNHGGIWDPYRKIWLLPYTSEVWQSLSIAIPLEADDEVLHDLTAVADEPIRRNLPKVPPMPIKDGITPFAHQEAAYAEAIALFLGEDKDG